MTVFVKSMHVHLDIALIFEICDVLQVKIDWDRYVDEDEEEEGFDTSMLDGGMGMGGMPGMGVSISS